MKLDDWEGELWDERINKVYLERRRMMREKGKVEFWKKVLIIYNFDLFEVYFFSFIFREFVF